MVSVIRRGLSSILRYSCHQRCVLPLVQHVQLQQTRPSSEGEHSMFGEDGDASGAMATTVNFLNKEGTGIFIDAYSEGGFRLHSGIRVVGPIVVFPRSILHWNVSKAEDINEESLSLFAMLEPKLDILILGVGERHNTTTVMTNVLPFLRRHRINVEVLPTDQALSTFNFLNSEQRLVAGAFMPPSFGSMISEMDSDLTPADALLISGGLHDLGEKYYDDDGNVLPMEQVYAKPKLIRDKKAKFGFRAELPGMPGWEDSNSQESEHSDHRESENSRTGEHSDVTERHKNKDS